MGYNKQVCLGQSAGKLVEVPTCRSVYQTNLISGHTVNYNYSDSVVQAFTCKVSDHSAN
jgi:hypothetical protein